MKWKKLGRVLDAEHGIAGIPWMQSHAMIPTADHLEGDVYRIYFAPRDQKNRSNIAHVDIDLSKPTEVRNLSTEPIMACGPLGGFDDSGVLASWIVAHGTEKFLYYIGYNVGVTVTFRNFIGLAVSKDGGRTYKRVSRAPVVGCTDVDPFLAVTPCVLLENGIFRMWYTTATRWEPVEPKPKHYYHIKYAESRDGIHWETNGVVCIDYKSDAEYAIARPTVIRDGDLYRMWFCCRGEKYRMGYAESSDGITWQRKDEEAGITVSDSGWDSEMTAYPFVFKHQGKLHMLYNGNGYGRTGFGLAVLDRAA